MLIKTRRTESHQSKFKRCRFQVSSYKLCTCRVAENVLRNNADAIRMDYHISELL